MTQALKATPQQEFQKCFQQWQHHWALQSLTLKYTCMLAIKSFQELHSHTSYNPDTLLIKLT